MKGRMSKVFQSFDGGLFSAVEKADVGDSYQKLAQQGVDLMGWADPFMPDFCLPKEVLQAAIQAVQQPSYAHYTAPVGSVELKQILANKLKEKNQLSVDPLRHILITPGSDSGLYYAMLSCLDPGDEVLLPCPSYPNNFQNCKLLQVNAVPVVLRKETGYQLEKELLEAAITPKTKMIVLTHPNNPTTTVYTRQSLEALREIVIQHDLILVCDQAFEDFTFEHEMLTPAAMPDMWERTISVFSVSKGMGLSGLRVGYIVCNDAFMDSMYAGAVSVLGATSTSAQQAVCAAFAHQEYMKEFEAAYAYRRKKAVEILTIPHVSLTLPESGFLCWVDVSELGNSTDITAYLLKHAHVSVNDGSNYGPGGEGHLRIVLGVYRDNEKVVDALWRIRAALLAYPNA